MSKVSRRESRRNRHTGSTATVRASAPPTPATTWSPPPPRPPASAFGAPIWDAQPPSEPDPARLCPYCGNGVFAIGYNINAVVYVDAGRGRIAGVAANNDGAPRSLFYYCTGCDADDDGFGGGMPLPPELVDYVWSVGDNASWPPIVDEDTPGFLEEVERHAPYEHDEDNPR